MEVFYVYQHRRPDTGAVFYVGKGKGDRAHRHTSRNPHWHSIVAKAGAPLVAFVVRDIDEELAHLCEREAIALLRRRGVRLANLTDGGDGVAGFTRKQRPEEIARRAAGNTGRKRTPEQRARIAAAKVGHGVGRKASDATKEKMRQTRLGRSINQDALRGRHRPAHVHAAIKAAQDAKFGHKRAALIAAIKQDPTRSLRQLCEIAGCEREMAGKYKRAVARGEI